LKDNQDKIDIDNARNHAILDGVAVAFVDAVLQFCQHPTLQYCWMRYLPNKEDGPLAFTVTTKIEQLLIQTPILRSRTKGTLRKICELTIVPKFFKTLDGQPMLEDYQQDIDLDDLYRIEDVERLTHLGLKSLTGGDVLERVRQDLASTKSKFKSPKTTSDWHERIADCFLDKFRRNDMARLQRLAIIPLRDGTYTDSLDKSIYFPEEGGIEIPDDLGLHIVDSRAVNCNSSRRLLFWRLGVVSIDTDTVRDRIIERYESGVYQQWRSALTVERSVCHLKYLYLTQEQFPKEKEDDRDKGSPRSSTYGMIRLFDHTLTLVPRSTDLYFPSEDEFGIQKLASGKFDVSIINEAYFMTEPERSTLSDITWKDWLHENFGILHCPKLSSTSRPSELSDTVRHIVTHRPGSFLGFIRTHWAQFSTQLNPGLTKTIADVEVPCKDDKLEPLHSTYLPSLEHLARPYLRGERFPFLKLPCSLAANGWRFLTCFGVGTRANIDFYLQVSACICDAAVPSVSLEPSEIKEPERVLLLYEIIQEIFTMCQEPDHDRAKIRLVVYL
jgi:hypothetical protein